MPFLPLRARQRPLVFVTPFVDAHDEESQGRFIDDAVIDALEPVVEPAQFQRFQIDHRMRAKVDIARAWRRAERMGPGSDDQFALPCLRRPSVLAQTVEVDEGMWDVKIVPAAHIERGCGDFVPAILIVHLVPVLIVCGVFDPIFPERKIASCSLIELADGEVAKCLGPVVEFDALRGAAIGAHTPGHQDVELECAAGVDESGEAVAADDAWGHAGQVLTAVGCALPLNCPEVGAAGHADLAVAPRLLADPFLGVVAVVAFPKRVVVAIGIPAAAAVLDHADVAGVGQEVPLLDHGVHVVAVGRSHQYGGKRALCPRKVDIGGEVDTVTHGNLDVQAHFDRVVGAHQHSITDISTGSLASLGRSRVSRACVAASAAAKATFSASARSNGVGSLNWR